MSGLIKYKQEDVESFNYALQHLAMKMCGDSLSPNLAVDSIYSVSNERLFDVFNLLNMKGKKVLTVGSSGDQVIFAILNGASKVTLIDANPMSLPYAELKLAAIKNLDFDGFQAMFRTPGFLNYYYYAKISHDLSSPSREFWDTLLLNDKGGWKGFSDELLNIMFHQYGFVSQPFSIGERCDNYRDMDNAIEDYYQVKQNLASCDVDFVHAELENFARKTNSEYDIILLSNIADYVNKTNFCEVIYALSNRLSANGKMQIHYSFKHFQYGLDYALNNALAMFNNDKLLESENKVCDRRDNVGGFDLGGIKRVILPHIADSSINTPNTTLVTKKYLKDTYQGINNKTKERIDKLLVKVSELEHDM